MNYWMIKEGESRGPYSLEQLAQQGLSAETKVWHQGLSQWTPARCVPALQPLLGIRVKTAEPVHTAVSEASVPTHLRAAVVTTAIIAVAFFDVFSPFNLFASPCFYIMLPFAWLSIRSALRARRLLRSGDSEAARQRSGRTVTLITLLIVVAVTLLPFHIVAEIFW